MVQKDTLYFLSELKKNNNREWFAENKEWYKKSYEDFEKVVAELIQSMSQFDIRFKYLKAKKCIFRIYRDIRFSQDKTPYKTHFGAVFNEKKGSGYYIHLEPEESLLICGHYIISPEQLKRIRTGIYENFEEFQKILHDRIFKKEIGDLRRDENVLKRVPNGFDKEHPAAEYLKLKHFYVAKIIPKEVLFSKEFIVYATDIYKLMQPLYDFLEEFIK